MTNIDKTLNHTPIFSEMSSIIEQARKVAYHSVNTILVQRNWLLGKCINEEILNGNKAEYGKSIIQELSQRLTEVYGQGFAKSNLYDYAKFNSYFPDLENNGIFPTVCGKFNIRLSWSHYRTLLQEENKDARIWYENEAAEQMWSVRTLQRNISSAYYHRMLSSQHKELVKAEMVEKTKDLQADKLDFIKSPVIAEFLGLSQNTTFTESVYDELVRQDGDNPTIGLLLCADTDEDIARYSVLKGNEQVFAAKYLPLLPTQEELRREIEQQKEIFYLTQEEKKKG